MSTNVRVLDYRSVLTISTSCKASVISSCRFLPGSGELSICYSSLNPTLSSGLSKIDEAIRWWRISLLPHRCRWQWKDKNWCVFWRLCPDRSWKASCHNLKANFCRNYDYVDFLNKKFKFWRISDNTKNNWNYITTLFTIYIIHILSLRVFKIRNYFF